MTATGSLLNIILTTELRMESAASEKQFDKVIVWFRRDLRVDDNPALCAAIHSAKNVVRTGFTGTLDLTSALLLYPDSA